MLDAIECRQVLATARIGRIALTERALPIILPVPFQVDDDAVQFPATVETLARAAQAGHIVCFEADVVDPDGTIRSVAVIGRLEPLGTPDGIGRPRRVDHARLSTATLNGSRFSPAPPIDGVPVAYERDLGLGAP